MYLYCSGTVRLLLSSVQVLLEGLSITKIVKNIINIDQFLGYCFFISNTRFILCFCFLCVNLIEGGPGRAIKITEFPNGPAGQKNREHFCHISSTLRPRSSLTKVRETCWPGENKEAKSGIRMTNPHQKWGMVSLQKAKR